MHHHPIRLKFAKCPSKHVRTRPKLSAFTSTSPCRALPAFPFVTPAPCLRRELHYVWHSERPLREQERCGRHRRAVQEADRRSAEAHPRSGAFAAQAAVSQPPSMPRSGPWLLQGCRGVAAHRCPVACASTWCQLMRARGGRNVLIAPHRVCAPLAGTVPSAVREVGRHGKQPGTHRQHLGHGPLLGWRVVWCTAVGPL